MESEPRSGKGFFDFLESSAADVVLLQEVKATEDQVEVSRKFRLENFLESSGEKGYSGVAAFSKEEPSA